MLSQIGVFDVSIYNASEGVPATYASLTAALAAVPNEFQIAGLTIKFINSTTSKYEQYRLTSTTWSTNTSDWLAVAVNVKSDTIYDFVIADENNFNIVEFANGHIRTKHFNSQDIKTLVENDDYVDFAISDGNGFNIVEFANGHIRTKHFNSADLRIRDYSSKIVNCLGDSITYGYISSGNRANPTWVQGVADNIGCVCNNYGVSATSICDGSSESFVTRLNNMTQTNIDILLIFGGTNDYGDKRAHTLGNITDTPAQGVNFYASFKYLIETAINKYPNAIIAIITPLRRSTYAANTYGISMEDIVNAEINVANYYGLPVLDMYHHGSINPTIDIMRTNYTADGLHPNQAGINRFLIPIFSEFTYNILKYL
jgi:lysophospholipase L1-like esterase